MPITRLEIRNKQVTVKKEQGSIEGTPEISYSVEIRQETKMTLLDLNLAEWMELKNGMNYIDSLRPQV